MLELDEGQLSRLVLRGRRSSNASLLPDYRNPVFRFHQGPRRNGYLAIISGSVSSYRNTEKETTLAVAASSRKVPIIADKRSSPDRDPSR